MVVEPGFVLGHFSHRVSRRHKASPCTNELDCRRPRQMWMDVQVWPCFLHGVRASPDLSQRTNTTFGFTSTHTQPPILAFLSLGRLALPSLSLGVPKPSCVELGSFGKGETSEDWVLDCCECRRSPYSLRRPHASTNLATPTRLTNHPLRRRSLNLFTLLYCLVSCTTDFSSTSCLHQLPPPHNT